MRPIVNRIRMEAERHHRWAASHDRRAATNPLQRRKAKEMHAKAEAWQWVLDAVLAAEAREA